MPFQESVEGIPNNTNSNISLPRSKRKISIDPAAETALPSINENAEPTKFNQIIKPNSVPSRFFFIVRSLYDLRSMLFQKWNSVDQTVPIFCGWLINIQKKHSTNLIKTTETYLPPILSKVDFSSIQKYIEYLQSLAHSVTMSYTNFIKENFQVRYSCFRKSNLLCTTD